MNNPEICFAIISPCHAIITGNREWEKRNQLDCEIVNSRYIPPQFEKIVECGFQFTFSENEARNILNKLGFKESKSLEKSHILDIELIFGDM